MCNLLKKEGFETVRIYHLNIAKKQRAKMEEEEVMLADLSLPDGECMDLLWWMSANDKR